MPSFDHKQSLAKPISHASSRHKDDYEHEEITDNRLVWEVLEEGDKDD